MKINKIIRIAGNIMLSKVNLKKSPLFVELRVTNKCNLRCSYCNCPNRSIKEMTTQEIIKLINEIEKDCIYIHISGGEALLRKDIEKIINHINSKDGIFVSIATNGYFIKENFEVIKSVNKVILSLDGPENFHNKIRGKYSFNKVMDSIKLLHKHKINFCTNTTVTHQSVDEIKYILDLSKKYKFTPYFEPCLQHGVASPNVCEYLPVKDNFLKIINLLKNANIGNSKYSLDIIKDWPYFGKMKCYAGKSFFLIDTDGRVYPCYDKIGKINAKEFQKKGFNNAIKNIKTKKCNRCGGTLYHEFNNLLNFQTSWIKLYKKMKR